MTSSSLNNNILNNTSVEQDKRSVNNSFTISNLFGGNKQRLNHTVPLIDPNFQDKDKVHNIVIKEVEENSDSDAQQDEYTQFDDNLIVVNK